MNKKVEFKGSVVLNPVPVVLITTRDLNGNDNVFTVAWTGTVCTKPPMLSISVRPERLSYEYIKETMAFTVNLPSSKMTKAVDYCGVRSGRKFNKIEEMGFTMKEGTNINVPYIDDCPISIECIVKTILPLGTHDVIIAEVVGSHINSTLIDSKGKIHFEKADLINYCHGEYFKMGTNSLGTFGFSVAKKKNLLEKQSSNNEKVLVNSDKKKKSPKNKSEKARKNKITKPKTKKNKYSPK